MRTSMLPIGGSGGNYGIVLAAEILSGQSEASVTSLNSLSGYTYPFTKLTLSSLNGGATACQWRTKIGSSWSAWTSLALSSDTDIPSDIDELQIKLWGNGSYGYVYINLH